MTAMVSHNALAAVQTARAIHIQIKAGTKELHEFLDKYEGKVEVLCLKLKAGLVEKGVLCELFKEMRSNMVKMDYILEGLCKRITD